MLRKLPHVNSSQPPTRPAAPPVSRTAHHAPSSSASLSSVSSTSHQSALSSPESTDHSSIFSGVNRRIVQKLRQQQSQERGSLVMSTRGVSPAETGAVMRVVDVDLGDRSYPIYIGKDLLSHGELLRKHVPGKRVLIVTNVTIAPLYLKR